MPRRSRFLGPDLVEARAAVHGPVVPRLERHDGLAAAAVADGGVVLPRAHPVTRSWPASRPPDRSGTAADRWSGPCWRRTTAPPTKRRRTRRSRGKSRSDPRTPLGVLPQPTICKLRSGVGGRHGVVRRSARGLAGFASPELLLRGGYARRQAVFTACSGTTPSVRASRGACRTSRGLPPPSSSSPSPSPPARAAERPRPAPSVARRTPGASATPTPIPTIAGIAHPTGATDVVLRVRRGRRLRARSSSSRPTCRYFTLYGDGTVVFVQNAPQVGPGAGRHRPQRAAPDGQADRAAGPGSARVRARATAASAIAQADYPNPIVADAPTTMFDVHADGGNKTVSVDGAGHGRPSRARHRGQGARSRSSPSGSRDFDRGGSLSSDAFAPAAYRAVLTDATGGGGVRPAVAVAVDQARRVHVPGRPERPAPGHARACRPTRSRRSGSRASRTASSRASSSPGPTTKVYSLVIRPLLPDEKA